MSYGPLPDVVVNTSLFREAFIGRMLEEAVAKVAEKREISEEDKDAIYQSFNVASTQVMSDCSHLCTTVTAGSTHDEAEVYPVYQCFGDHCKLVAKNVAVSVGRYHTNEKKIHDLGRLTQAYDILTVEGIKPLKRKQVKKKVVAKEKIAPVHIREQDFKAEASSLFDSMGIGAQDHEEGALFEEDAIDEFA
eukprot:TRINITY_DN2680_c0_g1_i5.p2 TRINITY_DN2680_c0_g1~~TRINITY_DN2680_c0_g1_i5.p2  ORF type:complete len:191 (+),score=57.90 TRINITY_DN2680_c0_g1_i5:1148-1720(+)